MCSCTFCDIVEGREQAVVIYEDTEHVAIMDRNPINPGHLLVLPKQHYETVFDMPRTDVGRLFTLAADLAASIKRTLQADGVNIGQNNGRAARQLVPHVHVHVIPRFFRDSPEGGWPSRKAASLSELERVAHRIRRGVQRAETVK